MGFSTKSYVICMSLMHGHKNTLRNAEGKAGVANYLKSHAS